MEKARLALEVIVLHFKDVQRMVVDSDVSTIRAQEYDRGAWRFSCT
jgi:hypothetical protein